MIKFKLSYFIFFTLFVSSLCYSQSEMNMLIDSLNQNLKYNKYISKNSNFHTKADSIFKLIDTTKISVNQVNLILSYYEFHSAKKEEYPYPLLKWSIKTSKKIKFKQGELKSLLTIGDIFRLTGSVEAKRYYEKALLIYRNNKDNLGINKIESRLGLLHLHNGEYDKAVSMYLNIKERTEPGNYKELSLIHHDLGDIYIRATDTINALKQFLLSSKFEAKFPDNRIKAMNDNFLGSIYLSLDSLNLSERFFKRSLKTVQRTKVLPYLLVSNTEGLGVIYEKKNQLNLAYYYYRKAFIYNYLEYRSSSAFITSSYHLASVLIKKGKIDEAIILLENSEKVSIQADKEYFDNLISLEKREFYKTLSLAYKKKSDYKNAFITLQKSNSADRKFDKFSMLKSIRIIENEYKSKLKAQEINLLKKESLLRKRKIIIVLILLFGSTLFLFLFSLYNKARTKALQRKLRMSRLSEENQKIINKNLSQEKEINRLDLELKRKELTTHSISLLQNKEQYTFLVKKLQNLKDGINDSVKQNEISNIISECVSSNKSFNWEEFKVTFENVHSEFYNNLLKKHPNLTTNEKKLCAFLKLGLNTKDICSITFQSNRSIVVARSRLRTKLNLNTEEILSSYFDDF